MLNNVLITWFHQLFLRNFLSFKQLKGFMQLSDEAIQSPNWNINVVEQIYQKKLDMKL